MVREILLFESPKEIVVHIQNGIGISHYGQGDGVLVENSVIIKIYTDDLFSCIFFIFNRETKHEKLRLDFQPRFHFDVCKGKLNTISRQYIYNI